MFVKEWIKTIGAGCLLLLALHFLIVLAPIWVPIHIYVERPAAKDMARPRACLTYQTTAEQLAYFEAMVERERDDTAGKQV